MLQDRVIFDNIFMKLADWAKKQNLSYMTCYRWFKENKMPSTVRAYQTESGTIIVEDLPKVSIENKKDPIAEILDKSIEYTLENKSISEFVSFIIINYDLKHKHNLKTNDDYYTKIITSVPSVQNSSKLKRSKELLSASVGLGFLFNVEQLENMGGCSPLEIFKIYSKDYGIHKIHLLIQRLKNCFPESAKINEEYSYEELINGEVL